MHIKEGASWHRERLLTPGSGAVNRCRDLKTWCHDQQIKGRV